MPDLMDVTADINLTYQDVATIFTAIQLMPDDFEVIRDHVENQFVKQNHLPPSEEVGFSSMMAHIVLGNKRLLVNKIEKALDKERAKFLRKEMEEVLGGNLDKLDDFADFLSNMPSINPEEDYEEVEGEHGRSW